MNASLNLRGMLALLMIALLSATMAAAAAADEINSKELFDSIKQRLVNLERTHLRRVVELRFEADEAADAGDEARSRELRAKIDEERRLLREDAAEIRQEMRSRFRQAGLGDFLQKRRVDRREFETKLGQLFVRFTEARRSQDRKEMQLVRTRIDHLRDAFVAKVESLVDKVAADHSHRAETGDSSTTPGSRRQDSLDSPSPGFRPPGRDRALKNIEDNNKNVDKLREKFEQQEAKHGAKGKGKDKDSAKGKDKEKDTPKHGSKPKSKPKSKGKAKGGGKKG